VIESEMQNLNIRHLWTLSLALLSPLSAPPKQPHMVALITRGGSCQLYRQRKAGGIALWNTDHKHSPKGRRSWWPFTFSYWQMPKGDSEEAPNSSTEKPQSTKGRGKILLPSPAVTLAQAGKEDSCNITKFGEIG
jgi:hypothetical protein